MGSGDHKSETSSNHTDDGKIPFKKVDKNEGIILRDPKRRRIGKKTELSDKVNQGLEEESPKLG
ncbi:conserved hypothetical protein [Ricinus communis]|uniref:Uncharacterized protein n=1 Tax=Ricinus communis TaxID=3988 RepID=B9SN25_RICCO|nr:conserved hypothetical protein [Ricinus communis]